MADPAAAGPSRYEVPADWWPVIDRIWLARHGSTARAWRRRARRARRLRELALALGDEAARGRDVYQEVTEHRRWERSAAYAAARARTVSLERSAVVAACGQRSIGLRCACPELHRKVLGCEQPWLCDRCRVKRYKRLRRRAVRAVGAHLDAARARWRADGAPRGAEPRPYLLTLTCPRTTEPDGAGRTLSLGERRDLLVKGWKKFRTWLHSRVGAFPYLGMPELTPGSDGAGHLHLHFVVIWPFFDWRGDESARGLHQAWRDAIGLQHATAPDVRGTRKKRKGQHVGEATGAAEYIAKYSTKGAAYTSGGLTAELLGEFVAIYYGKRRTLPSVGWWGPVRSYDCKCPACGVTPVVEEWPKRLALVDARATWRALGVAHGLALGRGVPWRQAGNLV